MLEKFRFISKQVGSLLFSLQVPPLHLTELGICLHHLGREGMPVSFWPKPFVDDYHPPERALKTQAKWLPAQKRMRVVNQIEGCAPPVPEQGFRSTKTLLCYLHKMSW
ncbi:hypothetical protein NOF04DRAFT_1368152 [Fusarium oxysporum II5]|nr:hypothetical protein NOF04DRAFT_1368152 [Fusarium oxysporum II5]